MYIKYFNSANKFTILFLCGKSFRIISNTVVLYLWGPVKTLVRWWNVSQPDEQKCSKYLAKLTGKELWVTLSLSHFKPWVLPSIPCAINEGAECVCPWATQHRVQICFPLISCINVPRCTWHSWGPSEDSEMLFKS